MFARMESSFSARHITAHLLASLEKLVATAVPKQAFETDKGLLSALEQDSEVLQEIADNFAPLMRCFHMFFFSEQGRTDLKYTKDNIVDERSAAPILDNAIDLISPQIIVKCANLVPRMPMDDGRWWQP